MTRQYHPFINPTTGLPECLYAGCGREIPSDHYDCDSTKGALVLYNKNAANYPPLLQLACVLHWYHPHWQLVFRDSFEVYRPVERVTEAGDLPQMLFDRR